MRLAAALATVGLVMLAAPPARAQEAGDAAAGAALARTWCSECHLVDRRQVRGNDAVPPFAAIAAMPSTTSMSLRAFLTTPHGRMPDLRLSRGEIDDVVAYILSLQPPR
jgi:mono/diheme cytochrome c family protein